MSQPEPIAIVGSGCRFPGGANSPAALWKLLENPRDVSVDIAAERFNTTGFYHKDGTHHGTTNVRQCYLLQEDLKVFDAAFFNISPNEADSIDPQQRLLLETVYEALEAGGHTLEALRGSDTAVYVGTMGVDYNDTLLRDLNTIPTYFATGTNRAIISNRVSYFYDWHGPSMTIDTACSSSLIAVHQGVQALRSGESRVAVACGTQVILGPEVFIFESKMKMLSPTGRSRMWDADADGYARGEAVAAVVLKRLSDALADGDHIEGIIRGTGANQDGFSNGITVPSSEAQAALIRQTYAKAGLNLDDIRDHPQFFEAHGTGTKAGDPKEAAAIFECFGQEKRDEPLYVGSVKTVIGHTEGAAGLAGLFKALGIVQNGLIPPNLLFNRLNPDIEPFYKYLEVPTSLKKLPTLAEGVPRRVSINSFGFGGSNAHAILEQYNGPIVNTEGSSEPSLAPFLFSAVSEVSLVAQLEAFSAFFEANDDVSASDLAFTLHARRSQLAVKAAFAATTIAELKVKIDEKIAEAKTNVSKPIGIRSNPKLGAPGILGVFTGQGAQWASMGAHLIRTSAFVAGLVSDLEASLNTLPEADRPGWSLREQMLAGSDTSRISEAELSQPLCTALQIILVELLKTAGISFAAVVGHSSGEIAAAYAAGFLSAQDAIRVAYYRGVHTKHAGSTSGQKGAMLAVGTSWEDAEDLINLRAFRGKISIAAHNSPASVTLSGDMDAIVHAKKVFDEEKKFARLLKVDKAYHSHHMLSCGDSYVKSLQECGVKVIMDRSDKSCRWFSSVTPSDKEMVASSDLQDVYWRDNMTNAVLFADAIKNAVASDISISYGLEIGPHPALQGPATQVIADFRPNGFPYSGVLSRGKNDIESFAQALGFLWTHLGTQADIQSYVKAMSPTSQPKLAVGLPRYQWNHGRTHWHESRKSRKMRGRSQPFHELLGVLSPDSTSRDMHWSNVIKPSEIAWLDGHQLQGQTVFPAAGYVAMALEAARSLAAEKPVEMVELHDLTIPRAITFEEDDTSGVETLIALTGITFSKSGVCTADFSCHSSPAGSSIDQDMELMASGSVQIIFGNPDMEALSSSLLDTSNMANVDTDRFYNSLAKLGYGYYETFRGMSDMKRRFNQSSVMVDTYPYTEADTTVYWVHPTWLDVAFQASMLAYSAPGDEHLWSLHVPTSIRNIRINPEACNSLPTTASKIPVCATLEGPGDFNASIDLFTEDGEHTVVQVEELTIKPFAPATKDDDRRLFSYTKFDVASPDGPSIVGDIRPSADEIEQAAVCERVSYYYLRKWKAEITEEDWRSTAAHHMHLREYMNYNLQRAAAGRHPTLKKEWCKDTSADIETLIEQYPSSIDIKLLVAVGENIPASVRGDTTILEHMLPNNMLDDFYKQGLGFARYNSFLASMMKQFTHRYPHAKILEIGAGTGGATKAVLDAMGDTMSSYTYTDVSVGFFEKAAELFKAHSDRMTFKVLDVEKSPSTQGYVAGTYDVIIASNVLHATASLQKTLEHTRQLLKPGGYLMLLEITNNGPIRFSNLMGGLSGWWAGVDDKRKYAPTITPGEWHSALRKAGFAGVDAVTPEVDAQAWPFSIIASQAVDDRVSYLRRPLAAKSTPVYLDSIVILGNQGLESSHLSEELEEYLGRYCHQVTILNALPTEAEALALDPMSTFVNLVDLDSPIFEGITDEKMAGLKRVYELARHMLWITKGAQVEEPYHMASIAFSRAMSHEAGHINMSHLDISDYGHNVSKVIAEYLLRQVVLDEWAVAGETKDSLLWSIEPEAFLDNGTLKIPRLVDSVDLNSRLNSYKRVITKTVPVSSTNFHIEQSGAAPPALVEQVLTPRAQEGQSFVDIECSSLKALHVAGNAFLYLGLGKQRATKENVLVLSNRNSGQVFPVASVKAALVRSPEGLLTAAVSETLAMSVVNSVSSGSHLLVHLESKDRYFAKALSRRASTKNTAVTFTINKEHDDGNLPSAWITLSARAPRQVLRKILLPATPTHFLDLTQQGHSHSSELSNTIFHFLPVHCKKIRPSELFQDNATVDRSPISTQSLENILENLVFETKEAESYHDLAIQVTDVQSGPNHATAIVTWPQSGLVTVEVRPLEAEHLFSHDKTYILFGLSGEIGRSITEWMVQNGAGSVVVTSRSPKINEEWLQSFDGTGASVKVFALDVTNKQMLEEVVREIRRTCPPIGGVVNGAMVLHDSLFSGMSTEIMQKVLGPKIDGSNNLDEIFYDEVLDFFVMFSSSACVIGNSGQSNYAASNGYLNTLARKRRQRGLAASVVDIGRVAGIGYVETAGQAVIDQLTRFGLMAISESEFHSMFAETIRAGYPVEQDKSTVPHAVVTTGIRTIRDDEDIGGPWFENPRFSHCIIETKSLSSNDTQQGTKASAPVTEQLSGATTMDEARAVLQECFVNKLRVILQLGDQEVDHDAPLVELGVDSLVAVEVRSWFLKELKTDIPVLKVVGGASPAELCELALKKLPESFLPGIGAHSTQDSLQKSVPKLAANSTAAVINKPVVMAIPNPVNMSIDASATKSDLPVAMAHPTPVTNSASATIGTVSSNEVSSGSSSGTSTPTSSDEVSSCGSNSTIGTPFSEYTWSGLNDGGSRSGPFDDDDDVKAKTKSNIESRPELASTPQPVVTTLPTAAEYVPLIQSQPTIKPRPKTFLKSEPLSFGQSRFWFLRMLLEDQTTSNVAFYYHIAGNIHFGKLEKAIRTVTARHESLRTCFVEDESRPDQAFQKVMSSSSLRLERKQITTFEEVGLEYAELQKHVFDLSAGDLIRLMVLSLTPTSHYLLVNYHHIVMDGVSFQIFLSDLEKAYDGKSLGKLPLQYPDFTTSQRRAFDNGKMEVDVKYWRGLFPEGEQPPVLPLLPMARVSSRVAMKKFGVHQVGLRLEKDLVARIRAIAKAQQSTPFHFYLAVYKNMLFGLSQAQDLTIGIADANRLDSEVMGSIGFFLNLLTLRFSRNEDQPFGDAVAEARKTTYGALEHSRLPFDVMLKEFNVERSSTHSPFFQAFFDYRQGAQEKHPWSNMQFEFQEVHPGRTAYDVTLDVTDGGDSSLIMLRAQKALYDLQATELLLETYTHLLDVFSKDPSLSLKTVPLFSAGQRSRAIQLGRGPNLISDWPETLPRRIDQIAQLNAHKLALKDGFGNELVYAALIDRIQAISEELQKGDVRSGSRVLVFQKAASDWVCSMLAIMRLGAIYVPLDLRNPLPRLASVAVDCEPKAVLVDETTLNDVAKLNIPDALVIDVSRVALKPSRTIENVSEADSVAAILYTSGSTGVPKGISVRHSGLRNEIEGYTKTWGLGAETTLQQSAFTFNHSSDQIYTGLANGGTVYVVPWDKRGDPLEITNIIRRHNITYTKATPSEYSLWMKYGGDNLRKAGSWRFAFGGGESLTRAVTRELAALDMPQLRFFNSYGPTEISISSTKMEINYRDEELGQDRIPCGYSLPNYHKYILDEQGNPLPAGMPGELFIGGAGVSLGYLNNEDLTNRHFISNPFATADDRSRGWTRMYRTGDICHLQNDGAMVFHSRIAGDSQVKIRGLRIEISDIESTLISSSDGALSEAIVTLREGDPDFLIAHVVFDDKRSIPDKEAYLEHLLAGLALPQYMVPVAAFALDKIPLNNHSKVDRKALRDMPLPQRTRRAGEEKVDMNDTMLRLKGVWERALDFERKKLSFDITPSTSFFLVGGDSLLVLRLQAQIREAFGVVIRLVDLLGNTTLVQMANIIDESSRTEVIRWDQETLPPAIPDFLTSVADEISGRKSSRTVLITGSTGNLAQQLLPRLCEDPSIDTIHCIAVRDVEKLPSHSKIVSHRGDLKLPLLGLTQERFATLSSTVDVVLHLGAAKSFWDSYQVLRASNVQSTRELIKLAAPRQIPIHYISTFAVFPDDEFVRIGSAAAFVPPTDGSNGYTASRWASEQLLERSATSLKLPSSIHRFLPAPKVDSPKFLLDEFIHFVDLSGSIPDMSDWEGRIDMVRSEEAAKWIHSSVSSSGNTTTGPQFSHLQSIVGLDVAALRNYIIQQRGDRGLKEMPGLAWIGRIKALGFPYFITSQQATVGGGAGEGGVFESRR